MGQFIDFQYVKQQADFLPVLAHYGLEVEGNGDERKALCPFHEETKASIPSNWPMRVTFCRDCARRPVRRVELS